jgi:hypothetical protein
LGHFLISIVEFSLDSGVTHVMTPLNVTARLPLVTSMAVMQPAKHVAHILANPTLEKVLALVLSCTCSTFDSESRL